MFKKIASSCKAWAQDHRRSARVIPVNLRPHGNSVHESIHRFYFRNWRRYLEKFFVDEPSTAMQRQLKKYETTGARLSNWYIVDVLAMSIQLVEENHRFVKRETGKGAFRQLLEMIWLAVYLPSMPENYYKFEWYKKKYRRRAKEYLHRYELKNVIYKAVNNNRADLVSVTDKVAFSRFCAENDISCAPTLALFKDGQFEKMQTGGLEEYSGDLFVKPVSGKGGKGAERIEARPDGTFRLASRKKTLSHEKLLAYYQKQSLKPSYADGFLVQPRVHNHPGLKALNGEAVATCRIVTLINEAGEPEPVVSVFRMPGKMKGVVDNSHAGGLAAPVDMSTGELGRASYLGVAGNLSRMSKHPKSGETIKGVKLPNWEAAVDLAVSAHRKMHGRNVIGWDIALTADGPMVIEANAQPCTDIVQRRHRTPLGSHRFGELILFHLNESAKTH